jgi:hypothetical protein
MVDANGKPLITLPKITYYKHEVELEGEPLQLYREIEAEISSSVKQAMKSDAAKPSVTRIREFSSIAQEAPLPRRRRLADARSATVSLPLAATSSNRLRSVLVPA